MSNIDLNDYIKYRVAKSKESYEDAKLLFSNERYNASINRLYYSCFYIIIALLIKNHIETQTHNGVRTQFSLNFIKSGKVDKKYGKLYSKLFDWRQKGDYGDLFDYNKELVEPLIDDVAEFISVLENLIK